MDEPRTTISNGRIYPTKDRPPSGAPKIHMKIKIVPTESNQQKQYILENFLLIWLDVDLDQSETNGQNALTQFRTIVGDIKICTQLHQCFDLLTTVNDMKMILITAHTFARRIVPLVHDIPHLYVIYILSCDISKHEQWIKRWDKVKGVHTDMTSICQSLHQVVKQYNQNSIAMTFLPVNETTSIKNLEQLDTSFLYAQIFQQILLGINYKEEFINDFILFWRYHYLDNPSMLNVIDEFKRDYHPDSSIWWYTRHDFVYQMINLAILRSEANIIFYLNCFLKNLNRQIEQLYRQQINDYCRQSLIVYRGQSLSILDFEKLKKTKNGLVCFNNFLSTNKNKETALMSTESALIETDTIGVLFKISINPSVSSIPFASIHEVSYNRTENEILFSMNSVFRVGGITEIEENSSLYEVELELIADNDEQFRNLIAFIEEETQDYAGWKQLYQTREEKTNSVYDTNTYKTVFNEFICNANEMKLFKNILNRVDVIPGDYQQAISYFEKALEICQRTLPSHHINFSIIYRNVATMYKNKIEYSTAFSFLDKALKIQTDILPPDHPDLAMLYNNIGVVYSNLKEYSLALTSHRKGIVIYEKILSSNHRQLAYFYDSMAAVYFDMQDYLIALSCYEKALEIKQKTIPLNQYDLVTSYTNIGITYEQINEHRKALSYHEKALEIEKEYFSSKYYDMLCTYLDIASAYQQIKEYAKVVLIYEELIEYANKNFPPNHAVFTSLYRNLGCTYFPVGEHAKALSYFEKQLEINQKSYPVRHPILAFDYHAISRAYSHMMKYSEALSFLEKALDIRKETPGSNDFELATTYSDIGDVYRGLKDYSKALSFKEKALAIWEVIRPADNSVLASCYDNIGQLYQYVGEHLKAISYHEKALEIYKELLPPNHSNLALHYCNIAHIYQNLGMDSKAMPFQEKTIEITENTHPVNHFTLATRYSRLASIYDIVGEYGKARSTKKKLRDLIQNDVSLAIIAHITNSNQATDKTNIDKQISEKKRRKTRGKK